MTSAVEVLATPALVTLVETKLRALSPFVALEAALAFALLVSYTAWSFGMQEAAAVAGGLSAYFAALNCLKLGAARRRLFGDKRQGRFLSYLMDVFKAMDVLSLGMVLYSVWSGEAVPEATASTRTSSRTPL